MEKIVALAVFVVIFSLVIWGGIISVNEYSLTDEEALSLYLVYDNSELVQFYGIRIGEEDNWYQYTSTNEDGAFFVSDVRQEYAYHIAEEMYENMSFFDKLIFINKY